MVGGLGRGRDDALDQLSRTAFVRNAENVRNRARNQRRFDERREIDEPDAVMSAHHVRSDLQRRARLADAG